MRGTVAVAVLVGVACSGSTSDTTPVAGGTASGTTPPLASDADPNAVRIPTPVPAGDIRITYTCGHSTKPFGTSHWSETTVFDLATGRATVDRAEGDDADPDKTKSTHVETILPPDRVAAIRAALERALAGGPYRPEHAVPEGITCSLSLWMPGEKAFFTIDKSATAQPDAISQLVRELGTK